MTLPVLLFILIPCSILIRKDLTPTDKIVYGLLRFYQHNNGSCWPSLKQLATAGGCSVRAISSTIGRLEKIGLLTVERAYRQNNVYIVQVVKDPTYLRVPGFILQMEGLSSLGKLVAAAVLYKAQGKGRAWPHQDTLAAELGCSRRSVIPWTKSGSPTMWATFFRGLREEKGSWKMTCISRRSARIFCGS